MAFRYIGEYTSNPYNWFDQLYKMADITPTHPSPKKRLENYAYI